MDNKRYRLNEFVRPADGHSLVIDTSRGMTLGPLPGLEYFAAAVSTVLGLADGLVTSPGQARKLADRTREDAALLIRADWTNAVRGPDFVLPPETITYIPLLAAADGLDLGASGLVVTCLLGFEEQIETECLRNTVQLALTGGPVGLPLIMDVEPIGPRVVLRSKAIELGVSYALECGADGMAVPWPGPESFKTIKTMTGASPVWVKPPALDVAADDLATALELGAAGFWLDERVFAGDAPALTRAFAALVHAHAAETA